MSEKTPFLPVEYADLNPGDMLYNPDWQWHTIRNYEGLSIGVPIREVRYALIIVVAVVWGGMCVLRILLTQQHIARH